MADTMVKLTNKHNITLKMDQYTKQYFVFIVLPDDVKLVPEYLPSSHGLVVRAL